MNELKYSFFKAFHYLNYSIWSILYSEYPYIILFPRDLHLHTKDSTSLCIFNFLIIRTDIPLFEIACFLFFLILFYFTINSYNKYHNSFLILNQWLKQNVKVFHIHSNDQYNMKNEDNCSFSILKIYFCIIFFQLLLKVDNIQCL